MSEESVDSALRSPEARFAENVVAETVTIVLILLFGIASTILIVRGLPRTPIYEFYIFVLVFTWVNILIPIGIMGMDVALRKHVPEAISNRFSALTRGLGLAIATTIIASFGIVGVVNLLLAWFPSNSFVPSYVVPFLQLALWTIPLTVVSTVLQGAFRGMQEMRYCTIAMGLYHGAYFSGLTILFVSGTMTLVNVILVNLATSGLTIAYETWILRKRIGQYSGEQVKEDFTVTGRSMAFTAVQALFLALLSAVFLYVPLLIANMYRSSDVILAGLGLALSVAVWIQQGLAAPFRVLMPRTAGDVAQQAWSTIKGYMNQAWKLGVLLCAFVAVVAVFYAAPVFIVMFAAEGMIALPFFVLMAGSFLVYPLVVMMSDTLIGVGRIRSVLVTNAAWTTMVVVVLWFLTPIGHEVVVALIWLVGIPFFLIYLGLYQTRSKAHLTFSFLPKTVGVLGLIAVLAFGGLWVGSYFHMVWSLVGLSSWLFQLALILTLLPLAIFYLWVLIRSRVFDPDDSLALLRLSEVLHPVSRPVSWLVKKLDSQDADRQ